MGTTGRLVILLKKTCPIYGAPLIAFEKYSVSAIDTPTPSGHGGGENVAVPARDDCGLVRPVYLSVLVEGGELLPDCPDDVA